MQRANLPERPITPPSPWSWDQFPGSVPWRPPFDVQPRSTCLRVFPPWPLGLSRPAGVAPLR